MTPSPTGLTDELTTPMIVFGHNTFFKLGKNNETRNLYDLCICGLCDGPGWQCPGAAVLFSHRDDNDPATEGMVDFTLDHGSNSVTTAVNDGGTLAWQWDVGTESSPGPTISRRERMRPRIPTSGPLPSRHMSSIIPPIPIIPAIPMVLPTPTPGHMCVSMTA